MGNPGPLLFTLALLVLCSPLHARPRSEPGRAPLGPSTESLVRCVEDEGPDERGLVGPRSVGSCQDGYLFDGVPLPMEGEGYEVIRSFRDRGLFFGTPGLVGLIERSAARVRERVGGSVLRVGNLSGRYGGPIRYSRSHQAGRDVDFAFFATDATGAPASPEGMPPYKCNGQGREGAEGLVFDTARNWALVEALLSDEESDVAVIFVAPCLKRLLLAHASAEGASRHLLERADSTLRPAGAGSYAHDDHFHVRIYCSAADLALGCRNDPRVWPWTRLHEETRARQALALRRSLRDRRLETRRAALREAMDCDLKELGGAVAALLEDSDPAVATAAEAAVRRLASRGALSWLRKRAQSSRRPDSVLRYLRLFSAFEGPQVTSARFLESVLAAPQRALSLPARRTDFTPHRIAAAEALAFLGRRQSVPSLIQALSDEDERVSLAAARALRFVTNQPGFESPPSSPRERRRRWSEWWQEARLRRWDRVIQEGFVQAGVEVSRRAYHWEQVRPLFGLIARGGAVSWNAQQFLRRFARENAPRVPHARPELAEPMWRAWLLSRLPVGAQL